MIEIFGKLNKISKFQYAVYVMHRTSITVQHVSELV